MKRCPNCKREYDDTLSFCLEDGTPLFSDSAPGPDSEATLVSPRPPEGELGVTQAYNQAPPTVNAPVVPPYPIHGTPRAQKKVWPWVLAIVGVLFIGIVVIVAAAVMVPQFTKTSPNVNAPDASPLPTVSAAAENEASPESSPSAYEGDDVPTDEDEVLAQLKTLENEWEQANVNGDREALDKILAEEYTGDGNPTKKSYLDSATTKVDRKWRYSNLELELDGTRATLTGRLDRITDEATTSFTFVDTFVWRDHRWQATSSRSTRLQ